MYGVSFQQLESISEIDTVSNLLGVIKSKLQGLLQSINKLQAPVSLDVLNKKYSKPIITLVRGNIVESQFEDPATGAIVNAANEPGLGGGGIDGAIHSAADRKPKAPALAASYSGKDGTTVIDTLSGWIAEYVQEVTTNVRVPTGEARWAPSLNIKTQGEEIYIILTTGPVGTNSNREILLANAYTNSLKLADQTGKTPFQPDENKKRAVTSIVFPAISTAIFGYDITEATPVALKAIKDYFVTNKASSIKEVRFIAFSKNDYDYFSQYFKSGFGLDEIIGENIPEFLEKSRFDKKNDPPLMFKIK